MANATTPSGGSEESAVGADRRPDCADAWLVYMQAMERAGLDTVERAMWLIRDAHLQFESAFWESPEAIEAPDALHEFDAFVRWLDEEFEARMDAGFLQLVYTVVFGQIIRDGNPRHRTGSEHSAYMKSLRRWRRKELGAMKYADYLRTPEWDWQRLGALRRAHFRCQLCNAAEPLDVHHRTYARRGQEAPEDLVALCAKCHREDFHGEPKL